MSTIGELLDEECRAANEAADRRERCLHEHGYGCDREECGRSKRGVVSGLSEFLPKETTMNPKHQDETRER